MTLAFWLARDLYDDADDPRPHHRRAASPVPTIAGNGTDQAIIDRIRQGDVDAFERLSEQHSDSLWRYAYRFVRTRDRADDVVQDVLFNLWQQRERLDPNKNVRAFLFKDTRFRALNLLRHEHIVRRSCTVNDPALVSGMSENFHTAAIPAEEAELAMTLDRVLSTIPEHRREILLLRWRHGFTHEEIADVLGLGVSAVKMQIRRATALLRPLLERAFLAP
jgi:RNA polymerase sigma factor (sigma-70 family)